MQTYTQQPTDGQAVIRSIAPKHNAQLRHLAVNVKHVAVVRGVALPWSMQQLQALHAGQVAMNNSTYHSQSQESLHS